MSILAPSILASDWSVLAKEIAAVEQAGADWLHLDVMDGHFVPPITFGAAFVDTVRKQTPLPLDVHLMIEDPDTQLEAFAKAGATTVTVHLEACPHVHRTVQRIRELGCAPGVALNPGTPVSSVESVLPDIDLLLLMTVNPGWGGQAFIQNSLAKIAKAASMIQATGKAVHLEVDGGINPETAGEAAKAGADVFVAGTSIFGAPDYRGAIDAIRNATA